jgi:hypothetical protein
VAQAARLGQAEIETVVANLGVSGPSSGTIS